MLMLAHFASLSVGIWQFKFAAECVADVAARTLTAEAPTYATIMELDKKVREFPLPEGSLTSSTEFSSAFQRCILEHIRETSKFFSIYTIFSTTNYYYFSSSVYTPEFLCSGDHRSTC
jgi:hypothetical protein